MAISGSASYPMPTDQYFDLASDGTLGYRYSGASFVALSPADMTTLTSMNIGVNVTLPGADWGMCFLFPQVRTITAWSGNWYYHTSEVLVSTDTTNGQDGTWNVVVNSTGVNAFNSTTQTAIRLPVAVNWIGVKGLRVSPGGPSYEPCWIGSVNLWGSYTPGGLQFWHTTLSSTMLGDNFDIGNAARGATYSTTFRIKNNHSTQTANNITISSPVSPAVGGIRNTLEFSDGGAYASSIVLTSLAAGATSSVITMRRIVNSSETLNSFGTAKVTAIAQSWT